MHFGGTPFTVIPCEPNDQRYFGWWLLGHESFDKLNLGWSFAFTGPGFNIIPQMLQYRFMCSPHQSRTIAPVSSILTTFYTTKTVVLELGIRVSSIFKQSLVPF